MASGAAGSLEPGPRLGVMVLDASLCRRRAALATLIAILMHSMVTQAFLSTLKQSTTIDARCNAYRKCLNANQPRDEM